MRKVKVKFLIESTKKWSEDFYLDGAFHQWGTDIIEHNTGFVQYTIGLVEISDGTILKLDPQNIKFVKE